MDADGSDRTAPFAEAAASERGRQAVLDGEKALACLAVDTLTSAAVREEAWHFLREQRPATADG
jgi:hypothetical protein